MKMKKMLAILAALSVLGTTGLAAGAEDATPTEPATEAVTTTEPTEETTETETTVAETTAVEEETTEETVATEENQTVGMEDASADISISGVAFTVKVSVAADNSVVLSVLKGGVETNLSNICVESRVTGELQVSDYYSVNDRNGLVIYAVDGNHIYTWSETYNVFTACSLLEDGEEENTKIDDTSTFQMNGKTVKVVLFGYVNDKFDELLRLSVYVDGKLTNLSGIVVNSGLQGMQGPGNYTDKDFYQYSVHQYFSVSDNVLTIKPSSAYGTTASYTLDAATNTFVASTAPTTTAATTDSTTTTTTTTGTKGEVVTGDFVLDGVTLTPMVEINEDSIENPWAYLNIYSKDGKHLLVVPVDNYYPDGEEPADYDKVSRYLVKTGSNTITVIDYTGSTVKYHSYVFENGKFVSTGTTTDNDQEKPLEIHLNDSLTVTGTLHYEWDNINENNNHRQVVLKLDKPITVTYMDEMENGFGVVRAGTTEVVDSVQISLDDELPEGTHLTVTGNVMYAHTGHHIRHIVLMNCTYQLDGKTDNGSASNAPASTATKNTSGTPKTGDATTVPAVAVGLTLTAAGVVAVISKRKKK